MRVEGARPPPLITFTLTSKVAVYAPAEWGDTLTLFHLYQYMYSVVLPLSPVLPLLPLRYGPPPPPPSSTRGGGGEDGTLASSLPPLVSTASPRHGS